MYNPINHTNSTIKINFLKKIKIGENFRNFVQFRLDCV